MFLTAILKQKLYDVMAKAVLVVVLEAIAPGPSKRAPFPEKQPLQLRKKFTWKQKHLQQLSPRTWIVSQVNDANEKSTIALNFVLFPPSFNIALAKATTKLDIKHSKI